jgi:hypothetical protein
MTVFSDFSLMRIHFQLKVHTAILGIRSRGSSTYRYLL